MEHFITEKQFWTGIVILIRNYNAVNKNIFACVIHKVLKVKKGIAHFSKTDYSQFSDFLELGKNEDTLVSDSSEVDLIHALCSVEENKSLGDECEGFLILCKFLSKKLQKDIEAVVNIDLLIKKYTCRFMSCEDLDDYAVKFGNNHLTVDILTQRSTSDKSKRWSDFILKPKLVKWCTSPTLDSVEETQHTKSLQLVDLERYNELYKMLKSKYAEKTLNIWSKAKESTDPLKYIYEDLAIAAYLICLWQRVGSPIGFADLGCGNGLLVYILSEEGYNGYGYDVRRRKIWACYSHSTRLIEQTIEPLSFKLPEDVDWLIGNHSDELSPWIPVLSATSSFQMRFFLLPCCAYEFSGAKFQRRNTGISIYQDFYAYLNVISQNCGFITLKDRLKIPSTKRLALIGIDRSYASNLNEKQIQHIANFVEEERIKYGNNISLLDIKLRDPHEKVRNCTQINKKIIDALILKIFHQLLSPANNTIKTNNNKIGRWQSGVRLPMRDIAHNLSKSDLQSIKAECGGIKTLLRNKHEIFEFHSGDLIGIRRPKAYAPHTQYNRQTIKKRPCFFHVHHPDGCPLSAEVCTFIH
ncbi:probable tRNA (uracil-O(2)-)-methyltransferase [Zeugodacus cucurbitae]|uniref:tRNA (uracil-O(2)-)-methyltransferase n=1 Tax=Zeugodacus cucurbitae TaxID=28588 RepID=A0A0A1WVX3_ZEUCU|nr:probable tRNA (uracil-O(2)-)-methyltransferase [Zeugodacus cucurbitae]